ncbi:MAG: hypothetical protein AB1641_13705 [Thermodesulfobacteriota bacterium]
MSTVSKQISPGSSGSARFEAGVEPPLPAGEGQAVQRTRGSRAGVIIFIALFLTVCLVHASNIWRLDTHPFVDLPNHLAEAYIYKNYPDKSGPWSDYFRVEISFFRPTSLHSIFCSFFDDVETGNKVYYTLYIFILMISMLALVILAKGNVWLSLLASLYIYNFNMMWGYTGFTLGVALALADTVLLDLYLEKPSFVRLAMLAGLTFSLFYAHVLVLQFMAPIIFAALILGRRLTPAQRIMGLLSLLPAVVVFTVWVMSSEEFRGHGSILNALINYYRWEYLATLPSRLYQLLYQTNSWLSSDSPIAIIFTLPVLIAVALLVPGLFKPETRTCNARITAVLFTLMAAGCYFLLPAGLPGQLMIYDRYVVFTCLGLVWLLSSLIPRTRRFLTLALVIALVSLHSGLWLDYFNEFKNQAASFRSLLNQSDLLRGKSLVSLFDHPDFRGHPAFRHFQNYHLLWDKGVALTRIIEYRFGIIRRAKKGKVLPSYSEWVDGRTICSSFMNQYRYFDFLLTFGTKPFKEFNQCQGYALVGRSGSWALFKNLLKKQ